MISLNTKDNQIAVTVMGQFTLDDYRELEQADARVLRGQLP